MPLSVKLNIALAFEVAASYGIAAAEFLDPLSLAVKPHWVGLSWVAVWTVLFTVVVPTKPRRALAAALGSVSAVPVVIGSAMAAGNASFTLDPSEFFLGLVFPYLFVVMMAYVGARVVYYLGSEVSRARELGSYRLVERLGQGGMGEVWRAKHRLLARPAAIKLIRPSLTADGRSGAFEDARRRFEREAQVIASLRSPHTVNLFDFGVSADGAFCYVMELLDGLDAETLVRRTGPVPAERAIHLLRQVCHSLSEAESCGLVHRDIKPATPPSARTEAPIPSALDDLVLPCLAKDPAARPQTARELSRRLASVEGANDWTDDRARDWWASHQPAASSS